MKIRLLGTGYGECKVRKKVLRDWRRRGGVLVDEHLLFDAPADVLLAIEDLGLSEIFSGIRHVVISHSHEGHFSPDAIIKLAAKSKIKLYASDKVLRMVPEHYRIERVPIYPFEPIEIDFYTLVPIPSNHSSVSLDEDCFNFVLLGEKSLFYALDGGYINYDAFRALREYSFDCVICECALGLEHDSEKCISHNNFNQCIRVRDILLASNIIRENTRFILSHIPSDKKTSVHAELSPLVIEEKMTLAYDGYFTLI